MLGRGGGVHFFLLDVFLCVYSTPCACGVTPELRFQPRELNAAEEDLLKRAPGRGFFYIQ